MEQAAVRIVNPVRKEYLFKSVWRFFFYFFYFTFDIAPSLPPVQAQRESTCDERRARLESRGQRSLRFVSGFTPTAVVPSMELKCCVFL